jgi:hypothetical protein
MIVVDQAAEVAVVMTVLIHVQHLVKVATLQVKQDYKERDIIGI